MPYTIVSKMISLHLRTEGHDALAKKIDIKEKSTFNCSGQFRKTCEPRKRTTRSAEHGTCSSKPESFFLGGETLRYVAFVLTGGLT